jgi:hypothetical protein
MPKVQDDSYAGTRDGGDAGVGDVGGHITTDRNNRSVTNGASSSTAVLLEVELDMSLIKMLIILSKAGKPGLTTRELLNQFQSVGPGQVVLKRAVDEGFVTRKEIKREDKKGSGGSHVTMNYITPAGKQHLKGLLDD